LLLRVRSLGRSEATIYSGLEARSKGLDTVMSSIKVSADGRISISGILGIDFNGGVGSSTGGGGTGGAVSSVFGRTGAVSAASGDYSSFYWLRSDTTNTLATRNAMKDSLSDIRTSMNGLGAGSNPTKQTILDSLNAASPDDIALTRKVSITKTTEQLRLGYDAGNNLKYTVNSYGNATITASGGQISYYHPTATGIITYRTGGTATVEAVTIASGDGTTSSRANYLNFQTYETSPSQWVIGHYYTKDFRIFDITNSPSVPRLTIANGTGETTIGGSLKFGQGANNVLLDSVKLSTGADTLFFYVGGNKFAAKKMSFEGLWFILLGIFIYVVWTRRQEMKNGHWIILLMLTFTSSQAQDKFRIKHWVDSVQVTKASWDIDTVLVKGDKDCPHNWLTQFETQKYEGVTDSLRTVLNPNNERVVQEVCEKCGRERIKSEVITIAKQRHHLRAKQ
jgi:hypothetical protein